MQKEKRSKINQVIGELVLCVPALLICAFIDLWFECTLVIVTILIYKQAYPYKYHADKNYVCIMISYATIFVCCCVAYVFKGQYILILVMTNIIAYANNHLGHLQYKAERFDVIKEPYTQLRDYYIQHTTFNVRGCTEEDLVEQCRFKHLTVSQIEFCIDAFIKLSEKELWNKYGGEFQSVINKKQYYRKLLMDGRKVREHN